MERLPAALLVLSLFAAGCGDDNETPRRSEPDGTTSSSAGAALPGERVELYPYQGARLAVVGVASDDKLNVRSEPRADSSVVAQLGPLATNAVATGHNRSVGESGFWSEIRVDDKTGWANTKFLLQPGQVTDITAALFPTPAQRPKAATMAELGRAVARLRASDEPPSRIVVVDGPTTDDLGEIAVDVIGLGDDAQGGERLKVFAEPHQDGSGFTVRTVEATALCSRGVTNDGLCV
jgi:hypothetical protein